MSTTIWRCIGKTAVYLTAAVLLPALAALQNLIPASAAFTLGGWILGVTFMLLQRPLPKDPHHDR